MRRDFQFLLRGIPKGFLLKGKSCVMASLPEPAVKELTELAKRLPALESFLQQRRNSPLVYACVRNDVDEEGEALAKAWRVISGILDEYSLLTEDQVPEVCELVQIRTGDSPDLSLKLYSESGWARLRATKPESQEQWSRRTAKLAQHLRRFFEVVASGDAGYRNDLGNQIQYSVKMFRHGAESDVFGIAYLSKFSALEGLVCGSARNKKQALLKERLRLLFRKSPRKIESDLGRLWNLRCVASHQANAFYFEDIPGSTSLEGEIVLVEYLFTGSLVFALDKIPNVSTVEDLWASVNTYDLPDYGLLERPPDMPKFPVQSGLEDTDLIVRGGGAWIDQAYAS